MNIWFMRAAPWGVTSTPWLEYLQTGRWRARANVSAWGARRGGTEYSLPKTLAPEQKHSCKLGRALCWHGATYKSNWSLKVLPGMPFATLGHHGRDVRVCGVGGGGGGRGLGVANNTVGHGGRQGKVRSGELFLHVKAGD
jgi:hypothetical protein